MKKINSIDYGGKVIGVGCIFEVVIPAILWVINKIFVLRIINIIEMVSMVVGGIILLIFFVHLSIEFYQDYKIQRYYSTHKNIKILRSDGLYECNACGNFQISKDDKQCFVCGVRFENYSDVSVQEILDATDIQNK